MSQEEHSRQRVKKDKGLRQGRSWRRMKGLEGSSCCWGPLSNLERKQARSGGALWAIVSIWHFI